jgi:Leucine-rich repeat (LRR) protein
MIGLAKAVPIRWLIDEDNETAPDNELALRQRYVLATLWFQPTDEENGFSDVEHRSTLTDPNLHECQWRDCDSTTGRVTRLNLHDGGLRGRIPDDLSLLTDLTSLGLASSDLTGTIPSTWVALTTLARLEVQGNRLSGTIPLSLGALISLQWLQFSDNSLTGTIPSSLGNLTLLAELDFYGNQLTGLFPRR